MMRNETQTAERSRLAFTPELVGMHKVSISNQTRPRATTTKTLVMHDSEPSQTSAVRRH